jgi:hypothetical protein
MTHLLESTLAMLTRDAPSCEPRASPTPPLMSDGEQRMSANIEMQSDGGSI